MNDKEKETAFLLAAENMNKMLDKLIADNKKAIKEAEHECDETGETECDFCSECGDHASFCSRCGNSNCCFSAPVSVDQDDPNVER